MSTPPHNKNDKMELEIFDSFSKTVMRNTSRNIASASKIIKTNETVSTDTVQYSTYLEHKAREKFIRLNILSMTEKVTAVL